MNQYAYLEVIDKHKVREEWQDIFNLQKIALLEELHSTTSRPLQLQNHIFHFVLEYYSCQIHTF